MISLRISRTLPAPPDRVWRAFTGPAALAAWFWPEPSFGTTAEVDLRPGGRFRIDAPRRGIAVSGSYLEVAPPSRLVFTWQWDGEPIGTLVSLTLRPTTPAASWCCITSGSPTRHCGTRTPGVGPTASTACRPGSPRRPPAGESRPGHRRIAPARSVCVDKRTSPHPGPPGSGWQ